MDSVKLANPTPLGFLGFGFTTTLLCLHYAGFYEWSSVIPAMGIFAGGCAEVIAGVLEYRRGNTFACVCFSFYGLFWMALVGIFFLPILGLAPATPAVALGYFLLIYGIFTFLMFIGTLKGGRLLQFIFALLTALFIILAANCFTGNASLGILGGWVGIVCGASAIYLASADILAEMYGHKVLPFC